MSKVYIVLEKDWINEADNVVAVFASEAKAEKFVSGTFTKFKNVSGEVSLQTDHYVESWEVW